VDWIYKRSLKYFLSVLTLIFENMQLIDTHAHIYLPEFDADRQDIVQRAVENGVSTIVMPAIDAATHASMLEAEAQYVHCRSMMGLHPCSVTVSYEKELKIVEDYLHQRSFAAVGEIGLDFYWDTTFVQQQYAAFEKQAGWALALGLPIVIHSRNAMDECIEVVKKFPGLHGIFHCFSGSVQQAERIIELGFFLGIGGVVTYKNAGLDKVIASIGIDRLVLETDAPYLSPVPYRGKRNESSYLALIAQKIADVTGKDLSEIAAVTTNNANKIFKLT
jgi:TatD DNase family protein